MAGEGFKSFKSLFMAGKWLENGWWGEKFLIEGEQNI